MYLLRKKLVQKRILSFSQNVFFEMHLQRRTIVLQYKAEFFFLFESSHIGLSTLVALFLKLDC